MRFGLAESSGGGSVFAAGGGDGPENAIVKPPLGVHRRPQAPFCQSPKVAIREGVTPLPPPSRDPFSLAGERAAVLLLHGFTSTPYEMRPLAERLAAAGHRADAPLLPGHGTSPDDLVKTPAEAWLEASREAFYALPADRPRFLVGSSMGGLLALLLAAELRDAVRGAVLLAPALCASALGELALQASVRGLSRIVKQIPKAEPGGDIADPKARRKNPCYTTLPVAGLAELERLRRRARAALGRVTVPLAIFHGANDRTIVPRASRIVAERVSSPWVERHRLPRSAHVLGLDVERDLVAERALRFVEELLEEGAQRARAREALA